MGMAFVLIQEIKLSGHQIRQSLENKWRLDSFLGFSSDILLDKVEGKVVCTYKRFFKKVALYSF